MHNWLVKQWYSGGLASYVMLPASLLFGALVKWRRQKYLAHKRPVYRAPVPVVVVGNITVGGTGKSPLVIWLVERLRENGYQPGVVSRGYGSSAPSYPYRVTPEDSASVVGDEPLMIQTRTGVPVVVDPDRPAAVRYLLEHTTVDVIISDDGLQHYALGRSLEIAVIDSKRGVGNGKLLPAGPLREPTERLSSVDMVVMHGKPKENSARLGLAKSPNVKCFVMRIEANQLMPLNAVSAPLLDKLENYSLYAVTGIGNPERFLQTLDGLQLHCEPHLFPDHHQYSARELAQFTAGFVLTTEKDAVKLRQFDALKGAYVPISASLQDGAIDVILGRLQAFKKQPFYRY